MLVNFEMIKHKKLVILRTGNINLLKLLWDLQTLPSLCRKTLERKRNSWENY